MSRRKPFDRVTSKNSESSHPGSARLTTSLRWPASRSSSSIRGVVPPQRHTGNHSQLNDGREDVGSGSSMQDAVKAPSRNEGPARHADSIYKRAAWLMSDAVVLTIASPFFAVWWIGRTIKRVANKRMTGFK